MIDPTRMSPLQMRKQESIRRMSLEAPSSPRATSPRSARTSDFKSVFETETLTGDEERDRELQANAQRRLEVKIRTRKLLAKNSDKKDERERVRQEVNDKLKQIEAKENESKKPELNENFSHYSSEVPLDKPPKPKPELSDKRASQDSEQEPKLNENFSHYSSEVPLDKPPKPKPELGTPKVRKSPPVRGKRKSKPSK